MSAESRSLAGRLGAGAWYGYVALVALFFLMPLFSLVIASFYDGRFFSIVDYEFSLNWYRAAIESGSIRSAFMNTVRISVPVTIISTIIGTSGAIAYTRYEFPGQERFKLLALLPIFFPLILLGLGMSMWASVIGLGY